MCQRKSVQSWIHSGLGGQSWIRTFYRRTRSNWPISILSQPGSTELSLVKFSLQLGHAVHCRPKPAIDFTPEITLERSPVTNDCSISVHRAGEGRSGRGPRLFSNTLDLLSLLLKQFKLQLT